MKTGDGGPLRREAVNQAEAEVDILIVSVATFGAGLNYANVDSSRMKPFILAVDLMLGRERLQEGMS